MGLNSTLWWQWLACAISAVLFGLAILLKTIRKHPIGRVQVCGKCGYSLHLNLSSRCPECGATDTCILRRRLSNAHRNSLLAMCIFALSSVPCLVLFVVMAWRMLQVTWRAIETHYWREYEANRSTMGNAALTVRPDTIDMFLNRQSNANSTWKRVWGMEIESIWESLNDAQRLQYLNGGCEMSISRIETLPDKRLVRVFVERSEQRWGLTACKLTLSDIRIDGKEVIHAARDDLVFYMMPPFVEPAGRGTDLSFVVEASIPFMEAQSVTIEMRRRRELLIGDTAFTVEDQMTAHLPIVTSPASDGG